MPPRARKALQGMFILLFLLATCGGSMAKQDLLVELFYSSAWHDVTSRVYTRDQIVINHGAGNEQSGVIPSDASLTFTNRDGEMNPDNRRSSLFGLIGHNTPIRITVDGDVRFSGQVASWKPRRAVGALDALAGRGDAWVRVEAQGTIRRLGQGTPPVESAMTRSLTRQSPLLAWWPLESSLLARSVRTDAGAVVDSPVGPAVLDPLEKITDGVLGTAALIDLSNGTRIDLPVPEHTLTAATGYAVEVMIRWQPDGFTGGLAVDAVRLIFETTSGTQTSRVLIETNTSSQAFLFMQASPAGSASSTATGLGNVYDGAVRHFRVEVAQVGSDVDADMIVNGSSVAAATLGATTLTKLKTVSVNFVGESGTKIPAVGQVVVYNTATDGPGADAYDGYLGELAGDRFERLCTEEGITSDLIGTAAETQPMGPQYPDTVLNLFDEIARTDAGIIHDTRDQLGLTFRTGRSLYNQ